MRRILLLIGLVCLSFCLPPTPVQAATTTGRIAFHPGLPNTASTPDGQRGHHQPVIQANHPPLPQTGTPRCWHWSVLGACLMTLCGWTWRRKEVARE